MNWNKFTFGLSLLLLVLGVNVFATGLHNIDNAWNIKYVESQGLSLVDNSFVFQEITADNLYTLGIVLTVFGLIITVIAAISASLVNKK